MPFPKTFAELKSSGYRFDNHARCKGCDEEIEWWITPKERKMPFNLMPNADSPAVTHFTTCAKAGDFRHPKVVKA
jgi:hypothetical protein